MAEETGIIGQGRRRPGPPPHPARDGDKVQARQRINVEVRTGRRPHPNELPCVDCGHVWSQGERRHEYDHHKGYAAAHHLDVEPVCTTCHVARDSVKARQTACVNGHDFSEANTGRKADGTRFCRQCRRGHDAKRQRPPGYWAASYARRKEGLQ